jgi:hypothetical protein
MPAEQSLISESLAKILGMQPGGSSNPATAGTVDETVNLGRGPISYISGAADQFGLGGVGQGLTSTFGQEAVPKTAQTTSNPEANPLIAAPTAVAPTVAAVPAPVVAKVAATTPAAPQMISRAALYELQKQQQMADYDRKKAEQVANLRSYGVTDQQLGIALKPTNWGIATQPANWGKMTNYMNTSMVPNPYAK